MTAKTGRNDPCPCGSGKKYKNCCIGKYDNVVPIGGIDFDIKRYENMVDSWDHAKGPAPTFNEFMGRPNAATESIREIHEAAGARQFHSKREMEEFMRGHIERRNNAPREEFLGLSSAQMHSMLNRPPGDNASIVRVNSGLMAPSVRDVPALEQARYLLERVGESAGGVKATPKGNLPRELAREFHGKFIRGHDFLRRPPSGEDEVKNLQKAKYSLRDAGFIKFQNGRYTLTKKGETMLNDYDPVALYLSLFDYFMQKYNWLFMTRYPDAMEFLQTSWLFCLYILRKKASDFVFAEELSRVYINAFPQLPKDCHEKYGETMAISGFSHAFLGEIAEYLGLVESRGEKRVLFTDMEYRTTGLFGELITWMV